ncbi:hypothetical protein SAMD00019534_056710 [Acytostelium subglobosum LB1]|uniref:hypothetical protein n=1 Tax=Acytostelium subglobosum LB1 TaxID=1410327 RepID=UPI0006449836|nr:hypothetical protein SAMD00019534_056710 [Acytostelium subglobosum LB1]GAM22496.1 hypothetical protein SAMD00019534_056710 [Acytostelium subglobosum LB1]|eukprot:XP_012754616.1 hypothetical protein SAMD00019534_056710 [Acytostelium subglobosum LB1]
MSSSTTPAATTSTFDITSLSDLLLLYIVERIDVNIDRVCFLVTCHRIHRICSKHTDESPLSLSFQEYDRVVDLMTNYDDSNSDMDTDDSSSCGYIDNLDKRCHHEDDDNDNDYDNDNDQSGDGDSVNYMIEPMYFTVESTTQQIPRGVTHLTLYHQFNLDIPPGWMPSSVRHLVLSNSFDKPIGKGVLPPRLEYLSLGKKFSKTIDVGVLPKTCKTLRIACYLHHFDAASIEPVTTMIIATKNIKPLPRDSSIRHVELTGDIFRIVDGMVPPTATHLTLSNHMPIDTHDVPPSVSNLTLVRFEQGDTIPDTVRHLTVSQLTRVRQGCLPNRLLSLTIHQEITTIDNSSLPPSLKELNLVAKYAHSPVIPIEAIASLCTLNLYNHGIIESIYIRNFNNGHLLIVDERLFGGFIDLARINLDVGEMIFDLCCLGQYDSKTSILNIRDPKGKRINLTTS